MSPTLQNAYLFSDAYIVHTHSLKFYYFDQNAKELIFFLA